MTEKRRSGLWLEIAWLLLQGGGAVRAGQSDDFSLHSLVFAFKGQTSSQAPVHTYFPSVFADLSPPDAIMDLRVLEPCISCPRPVSGVASPGNFAPKADSSSEPARSKKK